MKATTDGILVSIGDARTIYCMLDLILKSPIANGRDRVAPIAEKLGATIDEFDCNAHGFGKAKPE